MDAAASPVEPSAAEDFETEQPEAEQSGADYTDAERAEAAQAADELDAPETVGSSPEAAHEDPTTESTEESAEPEDAAAERQRPSPSPRSGARPHTAPVPAAEEETVTPEPARTPEPELVSRRVDQFADRERESADLLTADRLLDPSRVTRPEPEGLWSHLALFPRPGAASTSATARVRERKALDARIAKRSRRPPASSRC